MANARTKRRLAIWELVSDFELRAGADDFGRLEGRRGNDRTSRRADY